MILEVREIGSILDVQEVDGIAIEVVTGGANAHSQLSGIGTNTHAQIDTHIASTSNPHSVTKTQVGLGNVDNTSDANKPISTATQAALDGKANTSHSHAVADVSGLQAALDAKALASDLTTHTGNTSNPHSVTKAQVGLANVDNTSDASKPVSVATQTALNLKQNKPSIVSLTDQATIATDASLGDTFSVTLGGNRTLGTPTNPTAGQKVTWIIKQDATGSRTITLSSGFRLGTDIGAVTLSTTAAKSDYLGAIYNSSDSKWDVVAFIKGF
jgi:hypothetical protein